MSQLEHRFLEKLGDEWEKATPGLCIQAFHRGEKIVDIEVGETARFYDWASLTKIVFTTTALMLLHDEKCFRVNDRANRFVEWLPEDSSIRLKDLLSHSAGLTWWHPFYKDIAAHTDARTTPEEAWLVFRGFLKKIVLADLRKQNSTTGAGRGGHAKASARKKHGVTGWVSSKPTQPKSVYSDLDYFLLGEVVQAVTGNTLYEAWETVRDRLGFDDVDFHRGNRSTFPKKLYAPTEKDMAFRKKLIRGEAHDENTWALRGVAPHAGLFGPIEGLSRWGLLLRKSMRGEKTRAFASPETVKLFTKRSIPATRGDWALGFMMPTKGSASCGPKFSLQSVGHTGFTGTSLWYDPKRDLLVTILSNRVHPTRENREFLALRPKLHTWIAEEI
jgi:CubicO group peptidase (beta-lactamase class C family)